MPGLAAAAGLPTTRPGTAGIKRSYLLYVRRSRRSGDVCKRSVATGPGGLPQIFRSSRHRSVGPAIEAQPSPLLDFVERRPPEPRHRVRFYSARGRHSGKELVDCPGRKRLAEEKALHLGT